MRIYEDFGGNEYMRLCIYICSMRSRFYSYHAVFVLCYTYMFSNIILHNE